MGQRFNPVRLTKRGGVHCCLALLAPDALELAVDHALSHERDSNVKAFRQFETAIQLDPMLSEPLASLAELYRLRGSEHIMDNKDLGGVLGRHEIEEGVGELEQALKYYGKARRTAEFGLTAAGIEQRNQVGSCTDPNTVLTSSSFWLAYGMCVVERRQFSKQKVTENG